MTKEFTEEDDALLAELGDEVEAEKPATHTPREERIIAGFEDIQRFCEEYGRAPRHGAERDIFERLYAIRLERIRAQPECRALVEPLDRQHLLGPGLVEDAGDVPQSDAVRVDDVEPDDVEPDDVEPDDDALLAALGVEADGGDLTDLKHVRPAAERQAAEEIANRERCKDFGKFKPLFEQVQQELAAGSRETRRFERKAEIEVGRFFILGGQKAYIAEVGETFTQEYGDRDARLRVIFDNGTESNLLMRSLQRALHKDDAGRRITEPGAGPLFAGVTEEGDLASGTIYVLRSKSESPEIRKHRDVLHKIGVTGGSVEKRIANAAQDATFLLADVEIVATYELFNINRTRFEKLIHKFFGAACLDIRIEDRFGNPVEPREWFLVPLPAIDDAIARIEDGTISAFRYDPGSAQLVPIPARHQVRGEPG